MRVDVEKKNPALESLFTDPEQTIFLDANFFIPPDRSRMGTKPIPFLKFCEMQGKKNKEYPYCPHSQHSAILK